MPSYAQLVIDHYDWRVAYRALAMTSLVLAVPTVILVLRGRPEEVGLAPDGAAASLPTSGATAGEALKSALLWQLLVVFALSAACIQGTMAHLAPLLTDAGESGRFAALATSTFGASTIAGRVGSGWLVDRIFAPRVVAITFGAASTGLAVLYLGATGPVVLVAAALLGLALGSEADVMPFLVSRYFGMRSMATIYGFVFGAYIVGIATGRYLFALAFDLTGSYRAPLAVAALTLAAVTIATLRLRAYPKLAEQA
jgi:predicted MFS family arabinose efflux permease